MENDNQHSSLNMLGFLISYSREESIEGAREGPREGIGEAAGDSPVTRSSVVKRGKRPCVEP